MRRLCIIGLFIALAASGTALFVWTSRIPEPKYQGKPLNWWITERAVASRSDQVLRAETALREMGTNSLPYILSELQRDTRPMDWLMRSLQRVRIRYTPPPVRRHHAATALIAIGPTLGKPMLLELMDHPNRYAREAAARALAQFPVPEGQQALIAALANTNSIRVRAAAAAGLNGGGYFPRSAITPLAQSLGDPDIELRIAAAETLVEYFRIYAVNIPETALTNLVHALGDSNAAVRRLASAALSQTRSPKQFVTSALNVAAQDPDSTVRDAALSALKAIGPDAVSRIATDK